MAGKQINQYPESTSPSGEWFVLVDDGTGCYKKVKLKNLPGGGGSTSTTSTSTTSPIIPTTTSTTTVAFDPDALAFFEAAGITNSTEKSAVNTFVLSLKSEGLWTKMKALYPFVGSGASSHLVNLKQPGTFNLTFSGGWSYPQSGGVSLGATSNGTNAYADTGFNAVAQSMGYNIAIGVYSITPPTLAPSQIKSPIGAGQPGATSLMGFEDIFGFKTPFVYLAGNIYVTAGVNTSLTKTIVGSRTSDSVIKIYRDGTELNINTTLETGLHANVNMYVGAANNNGTPASYADMTFGLAFISTGLSDGNVSALNGAVDAFQTTLGRNV